MESGPAGAGEDDSRLTGVNMYMRRLYSVIIPNKSVTLIGLTGGYG